MDVFGVNSSVGECTECRSRESEGFGSLHTDQVLRLSSHIYTHTCVLRLDLLPTTASFIVLLSHRSSCTG